MKLTTKSAGLAILGGLLLTGSSSAAVEFRATGSQNVVRFPGTEQITYRLEMKSGQQEERFRLRIEVPRFGPPSEGGYHLEGSLLEPTGRYRFEGPASYRGDGTTVAIPACSPRLPIPHGFEPINDAAIVTLPPNSTSSFERTYRTGVFAPWPGADLRPTYVAEAGKVEGLAGGTSTLEREVTVRPPQPRLKGRTGVHITFRTAPASSPTALRNQRVIRRGRAITIRGRTDPPIPGQTLLLRYHGPKNERRLRTLARVRVGTAGRFKYRGWRPKDPGKYELWAFYKSQRTKLASDHACPRAFTLQ